MAAEFAAAGIGVERVAKGDGLDPSLVPRLSRARCTGSAPTWCTPTIRCR